MASFSLASGRRDPVFCPRPRPISQLSGCESVRPVSLQFGQQLEPWEPTRGAEVLDVILAKAGGQVATSPPYFCGSPPSRAGNPLVLDARFGEENTAPPPPLPMPTTVVAAPSRSAGGRNKGCVSAKLGAKANPAAVRVEGFDCLDRGGGRGGCGSIPAVA